MSSEHIIEYTKAMKRCRDGATTHNLCLSAFLVPEPALHYLVLASQNTLANLMPPGDAGAIVAAGPAARSTGMRGAVTEAQARYRYHDIDMLYVPNLAELYVCVNGSVMRAADMVLHLETLASRAALIARDIRAGLGDHYMRLNSPVGGSHGDT